MTSKSDNFILGFSERVAPRSTYANDILSISCLLALLDYLASCIPDKIKIMLEAGVLATWEVSEKE